MLLSFLVLFTTCVTLFVQQTKASEEILVISALAEKDTENGNFSLLELSACTDIADLRKYVFVADAHDHQSLYFFTDTPQQPKQNLTNITTGSRIYVARTSNATYLNSFFDNYFHDYILLTFNLNNYVPSIHGTQYYNLFGFVGFENFALAKNDPTSVVDAYGDLGVPHTNTKLDFENGWVVRNAGRLPTPNFNASDWTIQTGAYLNRPKTNNVATYPLTLGTYTCGPLPTAAPVSHPTQAGRTSGHNRHDHDNRPPVVPTTRAPVIPSTPAPVAIPTTAKPTPNPPRKHHPN